MSVDMLSEFSFLPLDHSSFRISDSCWQSLSRSQVSFRSSRDESDAASLNARKDHILMINARSDLVPCLLRRVGCGVSDRSGKNDSDSDLSGSEDPEDR